ncbi:PREDICTED: calnexin isoform X2 [Nicrophorus vespilloides]|uniref:Calnexin isoform X2 n=1 Tax=Nicrophorus vespilloides TaxID=110193 RepID=A0ABM1MQ25_NICVS|nr:PREDICTED: calnexin isoform X2 [Nicrophorus vespilloides]
MKCYSLCLVLSLLVISNVSSQEADEFEVEPDEVAKVEEAVDSEYPYISPTPLDPSRVYIADHFDDVEKYQKLWIKSLAKKEGISEEIAKYDGVWDLEAPQRDGLFGDKGLVLKSKAKHAAIASRLIKPFTFNTKPLIVQYEVTFQDGQECGGAYIKLLSDGADTKNLIQFQDRSPYTIMFGPDKCGTDHKLHFIFRHKNPKNGTVEEKHCKKPKERLEEVFTDHLPHLFTLVVNPDNTYEVLVDKKVFNSGSLFDDFTPPVNPPMEIDDPSDKKPEDWDEREKIPDPEAVKPEDWDEDAPAQIVDENAVMPDGWLEYEATHIPDLKALKPADWDSDIDGEWEPPLIDNPACTDVSGCGKWEPPLINNPEFKGKWKAPLIDNPNYKGKWRPKMIPNPDYYEDKNPFKMHTISAVGFELWSMSENILFDNIIITDSMDVADQWAAETYVLKRAKISKEAVTMWGRMMKSMNYRPKAWALYFLYCSIPFIFYIWYLWFCVKEEKEEETLQDNKKKTDAYTADDDVIREVEEEEEDPEAKPEEDEEEAEAEEPSEEDDREKFSGDDDEEEEEEQVTPKEKEAPRKRKPRKE